MYLSEVMSDMQDELAVLLNKAAMFCNTKAL